MCALVFGMLLCLCVCVCVCRESAAEARFWPKPAAAASSSSSASGSSSEEKKEATAESSSSSASAAAGTGAGADASAAAAPTASAALSADDALALMTPMRNLRAVDLLSFYPCASAAGLRSLSSLSELDTLAVGGAMLSPNQLDLGDPDGLAAQLLQLQFGEQLAGLLPNLPLGSLRHAMVLDDEIVAALGAVGDKGPVKVDRLTLAYIRVLKPEQSEAGQSGAAGSAAVPSPSSAAAAAPSALDGSDSPNDEDRKEPSSGVAAVPTLFHTLLSHFASSLLDLSLDSVLYLDDLSAVAQCLRLETLQLVSLRGLPCESLRQLQPLTKLFSLRISHMFVSATVRREFAVPSALMPSLREFIADGEFDPEEGQEIDGDEEGPQGHGHGHGHGHAHHHQGMGMGGNLNGILAPALNCQPNANSKPTRARARCTRSAALCTAGFVAGSRAHFLSVLSSSCRLDACRAEQSADPGAESGRRRCAGRRGGQRWPAGAGGRGGLKLDATSTASHTAAIASTPIVCLLSSF